MGYQNAEILGISTARKLFIISSTITVTANHILPVTVMVA
jgi:hypothetical protein